MTTTQNTQPETAAHPFAHLGPAPYRFVGLEVEEDRAMAQAARAAAGLIHTTNLCGGSCDHCGTAISDIYRFRAADGRVFKVGCSCAEKAMERWEPALAAAKKARNAKNKKARDARTATKLAAAKAYLFADETQAALAALPHPKAWAADKGETAADWFAWMWQHSGAARKVKLANEVKGMLDG